MDYYDLAMLEYYRVLNNAWKAEIKDAARKAIQMLSDLPRHEKLPYWQGLTEHTALRVR